MKYKRGAGRFRKGHKKVSKLAKLEKEVHRTMPTNKVYQVGVTGYISNKGLSSTVGNAASVFNAANGTTFEDRQNPVVHVSKVDIGSYISTSDTSTIVRGLLYTGPDVESIPVSNFQLAWTTAAAPVAPRQPSRLCDFPYKILYDTGPIVIGTSGGCKSRCYIRKTVDLKGMKVSFGNSTGSTVPDQYPIVWTIIGQDTDAVTTNTSHSSNFQFVFKD